ncbi:MAG TPA: hypothetical protein VMS76_07100 [Planctomycetota bacterium]|nr:hypothetical protein [Planctomycetota bacterium]
MMRWIALLLAALAAYVYVDRNGTPLAARERANPVVVVLGDGSCDRTPFISEQARELLERAVRGAAPEAGTVLADVVHSNALGSMTFSFHRDFTPPPDVARMIDRRIDAALAAQAEAALADAGDAFSRPHTGCVTDLLGGFLAVARAIEPYARRPRLLLVASNMMNYTPDADFIRNQLSEEFLSRLLTELQERGLIPPLQGVEVVVVGAGVDPKLRLTKEQQQGLRSFWEQYFRLAGARVVAWQPRATEVRLLR